MTPDPFEACLAFTLEQEGGFVDDVRDPGGCTFAGLTMPDLLHWDREATADDLATMPADLVSALYRALYWTPVRGWMLWPGLDLMLFDAAVNCGVGVATRQLQRLLLVTVDGSLGSMTALAARSVVAPEPAGLAAHRPARRVSGDARLPDVRPRLAGAMRPPLRRRAPALTTDRSCRMTAITVATAEDLAVHEARDLPDLIGRLQTVNPTLAAAFAGKSLIASRSPWGTILLPAVTWVAAYYGLGWPPEIDTLIAGVLVLACSFAMRSLTSSPITGWFHRRPMVIVTTPVFDAPDIATGATP